MTPPEDDVALKFLHTADWHLGRRFPSFDEGDRKALSRARLDVLDHILLSAEQHDVGAILCAGDLFDEPAPDKEWWEPVARKLSGMRTPRLVILLPGNHDPLQPGSVYDRSHPFRGVLPAWVHVVDRDDFMLALNEVAVIHARPCRSRAGQDDLAMALPARDPGDPRIRIGLVHGSTFDAVEAQTNFPIAKDAALLRGFDYLAIGDTHSFREVPPGARPPVVYPGAPEPTSFGEPGAGNVVAVFVSRARKITLRPHRVATWTWEERTVDTLAQLRELHGSSNLAGLVLRLIVDLQLTAPELEEAERLLTELKGTDSSHGRVKIMQLERRRMTLDTRGIEDELADLPGVLQATVARLKVLEAGEHADIARAALYHLFRLAREARAT
ncbi:MAG TPA: DNA repair exonuclease [Kofleriaceae bacterium]|nr:DNA repair exonuclease [Kofleriaceae bacterium]